MRRSISSGLLLIVTVLAGLLTACQVGSGFDPELTGRRAVNLYMFPPSGSNLPAQLFSDLSLESNRGGSIPLNAGMHLTGQITVPSFDAEADAITPQPVEGTVVATLSGTRLRYEAGFNFQTQTYDLFVPYGTYDVRVDASAVGVPPQTFRDIEVNGRSEESLELPELDPGAEITVTLLDSQGMPLKGAWVYTLDAYGEVSSASLSADKGIYRIQAASGAQQVWVGPAAEGPPMVNLQLDGVVVEPDESQAIIVTYPAHEYPVYQFAGQLKDSLGAAVPEVTVFAVRQSYGLSGYFKASALTDGEGNFTLNLPRGDYDFVFRPSGKEPLSGALLSGKSVTEDLRLEAIVLPSRVEVAMRVVAPDGSPLAGASLLATSTDQANGGSSATSGEDGLATMVLGVGRYMVEVAPPEGLGYVRQVASIEVTAAGMPEEEIRMQTGFSTRITIVDDTQNPVSGVYLEVWEHIDGAVDEDSPIHLLATAMSGEDGTAELVLPTPDL